MATLDEAQLIQIVDLVRAMNQTPAQQPAPPVIYQQAPPQQPQIVYQQAPPQQPQIIYQQAPQQVVYQPPQQNPVLQQLTAPAPAPKAAPKAPAPWPPAPPPKAQTALNLGCKHTVRVAQNGGWACPAGWQDTGLTWGMAYPDKQCQKCDGAAVAAAAAAGGKWGRATATYYTSYPECCDNPKADQTECRDYSGCKYAGLFAAFNGKKSKKWVQDNNIVAVFEAPNDRNRKEWGKKWKGKKLQIRNPKTNKVMEVTAVDTCDDGDTKNADCTRNANKYGGGMLIDLEYNTAKRFYDGKIDGMAAIDWRAI